LRPLTVICIGDYDPAGVLIDQSLQRELRKHLHPSIELRFVRIGINDDQIAVLDLPTKPRKATDRRSRAVTHSRVHVASPASTGYAGCERNKRVRSRPANDAG